MKTEPQLLFRRLNERFVKAFVTYRLLEDDDYVLVGLSGGKDSLLLLELLAKRARISHPRFRVEALHVRMENISYETSTDYLERFCHQLGVPLHIITTRFEIRPSSSSYESSDLSPISPPSLPTPQLKQKSPCFLCSWHRRKQLFNLAQELGCNKIALGHHQDDLLHTTLMNLTLQGRFGTMPAKLKMKKMPLTIIRPLSMIEEADIRRYALLSGYEKQTKLCPYEDKTHRNAMRQLFENTERINPEVRYSLWNALNRDGKLIEEY